MKSWSRSWAGKSGSCQDIGGCPRRNGTSESLGCYFVYASRLDGFEINTDEVKGVGYRLPRRSASWLAAPLQVLPVVQNALNIARTYMT